MLENSRFMALMWVSVADAIEACFDSKYRFDRWRPQSAIPLADTDANDATVLERFFGADKIDFVLDSAVPGLAMPVREYHDVDDMVKDLSVARIYGGMHYRTSTKDGILLGKRVANWVSRDFFKKRKASH